MPYRRLLPVILALSLALLACAALGGGVPAITVSPSEATAAATLEELTSVPGEIPTETAAPAETAAPPPASVAAFPDPQNYKWTEVVSGLQSPIDIVNAGDGSARLFIIEQPGRIRVVQDGRLLDAPFLDITDRVGDNGSERGLLGLAFHPQYKENGYFYVNYTDNNGDTVIARFQVSADANTADPGSEKKLLGVDQPFANHNGGSMAFGPDGYLYLGLGDGGSGGDPFRNGQSLTTFLGKILRIDVDSGDPYVVPIDNPFMTGNVAHEIWAYGLRNPWRFSFDSATGDFYIGEVGQDHWEEIDYLRAGSPGGANFGWNIMEGTHFYNGGNTDSLVAPVAEYSHNEGGCSVTGGNVYRGAALPEWNGVYLYGDYCTGKVWGLLKNGSDWQSQLLFETQMSISTFGVDENGEIYLAWYGGGIYRLEKR